MEQARADAETKLREGEARIRTAEIEAKETALKVRSGSSRRRTRQKEIPRRWERRVLQHGKESWARRLEQLDGRGARSRRATAPSASRQALAAREAQLGVRAR